MASWIWPASYSVLTLALYQKKIGQVQVREKPEQRNLGEVTSSLGASGSASVQSLASQGSGEGKHVGDCSGLRRMPQTLAHLCGGLMPLTVSATILGAGGPITSKTRPPRTQILVQQVRERNK